MHANHILFPNYMFLLLLVESFLFYLIQQFGLHIFGLFMMYCTVGILSTYERLPYL